MQRYTIKIKPQQYRDSLGRFAKRKFPSVFLLIIGLTLGMYVQTIYMEYNDWYCRQYHLLNIHPTGLPTACPINPITTKEIPALWFMGEVQAQEPVVGDLYDWVHNLTPTVYEATQSATVDKIKAAFGKDGDDAVKVAFCESSLNPEAKNKRSSARGLFQIMASVHGVREKWLLNEDVNIQVAKQLFDEQGWNPWLASNNCHGLLD
jgi:hypothetical protein